MSNITVTHADSGLVEMQVLRSEQLTPHMVRLTFGGPGLQRFTFLGFDQWVRLAIPVHSDDRFDNLPSRFGIGGYLRYRMLPKGTRPVIRNYTVRDFRADALELDIDFVTHGSEGIAGPWAESVQPGEPAAFIDQGCGWSPTTEDWSLIIVDESGLPAALGILRDLPRTAVGHTIIELFDDADRQPVDPPPGMQVQWLERPRSTPPGTAALPALAELPLPDGPFYAFTVGEAALATGVRRHLVDQRGVSKQDVTFSGYWRTGRAAPT